MAEKVKGTGRGLPALLVVGAAAAAFSATLYFITKVAAAGSMALAAGANLVTYTGKDQYAGDAFASIIDYLVIAYYWNPDTEEWEQVAADTILVNGEEYSITVSDDCVWTF